jgi:hypothetical protein
MPLRVPSSLLSFWEFLHAAPRHPKRMESGALPRRFGAGRGLGVETPRSSRHGRTGCTAVGASPGFSTACHFSEQGLGWGRGCQDRVIPARPQPRRKISRRLAPLGGRSAPRGRLSDLRGELSDPTRRLTAPRDRLTALQGIPTAPRGRLTAPPLSPTAPQGQPTALRGQPPHFQVRCRRIAAGCPLAGDGDEKSHSSCLIFPLGPYKILVTLRREALRSKERRIPDLDGF